MSVNKKPRKTITTQAAMCLSRNGPKDQWRLDWPGGIQEAAFTMLTHDEIVRFPGLAKFLRDRIGTIPVTVTIGTGPITINEVAN